MRKLATALREAGYKVIETREPGGTPDRGEDTPCFARLGDGRSLAAGRNGLDVRLACTAYCRGDSASARSWSDCVVRSLYRFHGSLPRVRPQAGQQARAGAASRPLRRYAARFDHPARLRPGDEYWASAEAQPAVRRPGSQKCEQARRREPLRAAEPQLLHPRARRVLSDRKTGAATGCRGGCSRNPSADASQDYGSGREETSEKRVISLGLGYTLGP